MAFIRARPIARDVVGLVLTALLAATLPVAQGAAQTNEATPAAGPATGAGTQEAQNPPDTASDGGSRPAQASGDAQERDRRLMLLRLLVVGGGSYRPFGLFR